MPVSLPREEDILLNILLSHPEPEVRASPNFRCAKLFASDPKPGTPKKVKVYEIIQENKKEKKKRKETNKGKKKPKRSQRKRLSQGRVMRMTCKRDKVQA